GSRQQTRHQHAEGRSQPKELHDASPLFTGLLERVLRPSRGLCTLVVGHRQKFIRALEKTAGIPPATGGRACPPAACATAPIRRSRGFVWQWPPSPAGAGFPGAAPTLPLRAARHSSNRRTTTKNDGTNNTARQVEASMPLNTVIPIDLRALAPAPVATTRGATPRMKANDVIRIGRRRARAASTAA